MRGKYLVLLLGSAAVLALLPGTTERTALAETTGTPTLVSGYGCIVVNGGHATRPAGSTIIIGQGFSEQTLGILREFLNAQTTIISVNDGQMVDVSNQYSEPAQRPQGDWLSSVEVPTGVTLAQPGDQMRFTFALVLSRGVPEVFNPAAGGEPGPPIRGAPGLSFGGTCTVTAT